MCQDDDATFTCVLFVQPSATAVSPGWRINGEGVVDPMRHTLVDNLTTGAVGPVYVSSTITVNSITVLDDDGVLYQCGISGLTTTNNATLTVVGMYVHII